MVTLAFPQDRDAFRLSDTLRRRSAASLTSRLGIRSRDSSRLNCLLLLLDVADRAAVAAVRPMTFSANVCSESPGNCFISNASTSIPGICSFRNSTTRVSSSGIPSATKSRHSLAARRLVSTSCQNSSASGSSSVCNSSLKTLFESWPAEVVRSSNTRRMSPSAPGMAGVGGIVQHLVDVGAANFGILRAVDFH